MPYCDDGDGYCDDYDRETGWDEREDKDVRTNYDGHEMWVKLQPNNVRGDGWTASLPARMAGRGMSIIFINGIKPSDDVVEGQGVCVVISAIRDREDINRFRTDKCGNYMYVAVPADCDETRNVWFQDDNDPDCFYHVRTHVDWRGRIKENANEDLIGVRSRVIEFARETHLVDGWIDWEKMVVNTKSTMTIAVSTMTQLPSGSWTPVESTRYEAEDRADPIVAVRFADNKWPMNDLYPAPTSTCRVKLLVQTSSGKEFVLDDLGTSWCDLPKTVQKGLQEAYPLCRICAKVRHPKDKPHCTDGGPVPASAASLQALAARFGGGA